MIPRQFKLKSKKQIETVFRKGKKIHSDNFILAYYSTQSSLPKILVTIPKKHTKLATDRKKISRRVNAVISKSLNVFEGFGIMINSKNPTVLKLQFQDLENEINYLLNQFAKFSKIQPKQQFRTISSAVIARNEAIQKSKNPKTILSINSNCHLEQSERSPQC
jgi:ribonuclease P protein component